jgi:phosphoglycolate phosphatase
MATRAVIFDIDGTLLDTRDRYLDCMHTVFRKYSGRTHFERIIRESFGLPGREIMRRIGVPERDYDRLGKDIRAYMCGAAVHAVPYDGIIDMLDTLKPHFRLAAATSRIPEEVSVDTDLRVIVPRMDIVCATTRDMTPKPAPDVLRAALAALDAAPHEAVYVGDTLIDADCAGATGVPFIAAGWNQDTRRFLTGRAADMVFCDTPYDLAGCIERSGSIRIGG